MIRPDMCVLKTDGSNCDVEMMYALEVSGGNPEIVHINQLRSGEKHLSSFGGLALPGGFSYGDDVASGKVLAVEMTSFLADQLLEFNEAEKPTIGVCNGFQILTKTGLLPKQNIGSQTVTLTDNESGRFECRWIELEIGKSVCKFIQAENFKSNTIPMQIAHGEGKFIASEYDIKKLKDNKQIVLSYANLDHSVPVEYPNNPNGSIDNIAGICDQSGLILGLMPHPERSFSSFHPHRKRTELAVDAAKFIFQNLVAYAKES